MLERLREEYECAACPKWQEALFLVALLVHNDFLALRPLFGRPRPPFARWPASFGENK